MYNGTMMNIKEYKKTYPAIILVTIWLLLVFLFFIFVYNFEKDTGLVIVCGTMSLLAIICILLDIFKGERIDYIKNNTNDIIIKYKKGRYKQEVHFEKNNIEKLIFNFYIKAKHQKMGFYNYICMDINFILKSGESVKLKDEYVMNGLVLHVGKNVNQIYSVKHIVNMFNDFDKFSYNIKNIHAIYDKKYEPNAIRLLLEK